jgi:hypothetical protein
MHSDAKCKRASEFFREHCVDDQQGRCAASFPEARIHGTSGYAASVLLFPAMRPARGAKSHNPPSE